MCIARFVAIESADCIYNLTRLQRDCTMQSVAKLLVESCSADFFQCRLRNDHHKGTGHKKFAVLTGMYIHHQKTFPRLCESHLLSLAASLLEPGNQGT